MFPFADSALAKRLEAAEGRSCRQYAESRCNVFPGSNSEWMEFGGANCVFDGIDSPITQTFGLGLFEELTPAVLQHIENFFLDRGAPVMHEICPLVGPAALSLLCARHYQPIEISSVLYRPAEQPAPLNNPHISVRVINRNEADTWADVNARAWTHDHPELLDFMREFGRIAAARPDCPSFLAEFDGQPAAAASLSIHDGVALFAGAATMPELRCRGLQAALLHERMRHAFDQGCDLAMMVAEAGSNSQRNAERKGFRLAYTRTKWKLAPVHQPHQ
jgi:GNAT superfamily N-acetyltransferase